MRDTRDTFDCVIPFYNEKIETLVEICREMHEVDAIGRIVCIDDGSENNISEILQQHCPFITLVRSETNQGKSAAVFLGLQQATHANIFLFDADLREVRSDELVSACDLYTKDKTIGCLILENQGDNAVIDSLLRKRIVFSGKRLLRRKDLLEVEKLRPRRYQLEIAINAYLMEKKAKVVWTKNSAYNAHKVKKNGWFDGIKSDLRMDWQLISFRGLWNYLKQLIFFARRQIVL